MQNHRIIKYIWQMCNIVDYWYYNGFAFVVRVKRNIILEIKSNNISFNMLACNWIRNNSFLFTRENNKEAENNIFHFLDFLGLVKSIKVFSIKFFKSKLASTANFFKSLIISSGISINFRTQQIYIIYTT